MKSREERRKTLIKARMLAGAAWSDVCIVNLSSRGAGLQCACPPVRGTYVEIRRGSHVIVGQVVWSGGHRFGVRTQDRLAVSAIIAEPENSAASPPGRAANQPVERRAKPRTRNQHERSRWLGRIGEFACIAVLGAGAALTIYSAVEQAFARPLGLVTGAISKKI